MSDGAANNNFSRGQKAPRAMLSGFIDDECDEEEAVGAQPLDEPEVMDEEDDEEGDFENQPDVLEYLDQWDIPTVDKISMLRTAANYLTTRAKSENPELRTRRLR